ncbi:MAG: YafY family transcriptional regulator [Chthonomonadaceae bacterium]|nr:YafY family transcriptional regulator [Chthonomonadaceae bacterium]
MYRPTTRVLSVLEMLQSHDRVTGAEIAERLEVHIRTVRRYIAILEDLGIPMAAERGRYGAYRLLPGYKLPPLMFAEGEALALTLGLLAVKRLGLAGAAPGVEGALAKLERVLPAALREKVQALEETLILDLYPGKGEAVGEAAVTLSMAAANCQRVCIRYLSLEGNASERAFDPYGLVYRRSHWYAAGYCHLRGSVRLFRLDRMVEAKLLEETFERPKAFDVLDFVRISLGSVPRHWSVEVLLKTKLEKARRHIIPEIAVLEPVDSGVMLRCSTFDLPWMARILAGLDCSFVVHRPVELKEAIKQHAISLMETALE